MSERNSNPSSCIHHLLATQAERNPDAVVILAPGRTPLTYGQLQTHVKDVVKTLNAMGIGRNDRVATVLPNGPEMAVAFIAFSTAGTSAPLNPAYRAREFNFYLSDFVPFFRRHHHHISMPIFTQRNVTHDLPSECLDRI